MAKPLVVRVTPRNRRKTIHVYGNRDPRGPDNTIEVWLDETDRLHILVPKAQRCYRFESMIDMPGHVEIIQA